MPATITASGTWTVLDMDVSGVPAASQQRREIESMNFERIKETGHSELQQFIQAMAVGYGINYAAAVALLTHLTALESNRQSPTLAMGTRTTS